MSSSELLSLTVKLTTKDHLAVCAKSNRSAWVRNAISEKLDREATRPTRPRSPLGRKLLAARAEFVKSGGRPLSLDEMAKKLSADELITAERPGKPMHKVHGLKICFLPNA